MKTILLLLLSFTLLFSVFGSSCTSGTSPTTDDPDSDISSVPDEPKSVTVFYCYNYVNAPYVRGYSDDWWSCVRESLDMDPIGGRYEFIPWSEELGVAPGGTITLTEDRPVSHVYVSEEVYAFFESGSTAKRAFLIQNYNKDDCVDITARDAAYAEWCETDFVGGNVSEKTGHIVWTGHAATLLEIAQNLKTPPKPPYQPSAIPVLICFPSEFNDIYGVSMEDARKLIDKGILDGWSTPTDENSPLYALNPAEIAAYIAAHPELLEE